MPEALEQAEFEGEREAASEAFDARVARGEGVVGPDAEAVGLSVLPRVGLGSSTVALGCPAEGVPRALGEKVAPPSSPDGVAAAKRESEGGAVAAVAPLCDAVIVPELVAPLAEAVAK